jgi:hypothetical protein
MNGYLATVSNLKHPVHKWHCGGAPITAMMTVKRWLRGPGVSQIGKPAVHCAKVDLKGKPYEYVFYNPFQTCLVSFLKSLSVNNQYMSYHKYGAIVYFGKLLCDISVYSKLSCT